MNREIKIAIFGAPVNNSNLGCQALTYSLIDLLEEISKEKEIGFTYYIFEWNPSDAATQRFIKTANIISNKLYSVKQGNLHDFMRRCKNVFVNKNMKDILEKCQYVIDLTEGDSFTDIYGDYRFDTQTKLKQLAECMGLKLILASQTYGPFTKEKNAVFAADVIKNAYRVFARDKISADYVTKISDIVPELTCDLAFRLPYEKTKRNGFNTLKSVGLNVSGLLVNNSSEDTKKEFELKTDYDEYLDRLIQFLLNKDYSVTLIGHVEADYDAINRLKNTYPQLKTAPAFENPIQAKSYISAFDLFIGSRMHATIAALTSGVPVIPVAYSRKFSGLFDFVNYPFVVDLQKMGTDDSVKTTEQYISNYQELVQVVGNSYKIAMDKVDDCYKKYSVIFDELK